MIQIKDDLQEVELSRADMQSVRGARGPVGTVLGVVTYAVGKATEGWSGWGDSPACGVTSSRGCNIVTDEVKNAGNPS